MSRNTNRSAFRNDSLLAAETADRPGWVCIHCRREVEAVNRYSACEGCTADIDAAVERDCDGVANDAPRGGCEECGGCGYVRSYRMTTEADCDLAECPACHGESEPDDCDGTDPERDAWCDALRAEAIEHECAAERPLPHRAVA